MLHEPALVQHDRGASARLSVVVADGLPLFREGLEKVVADDLRLRLVGTAADGRQAYTLIRDTAPDVAVLDVGLSGWSGAEVAMRLQRDELATRVLLLIELRDGDPVYQHLVAGAAGLVTKSAAAQELADAIADVGGGRTVLSQEVSARLLGQLQERHGQSMTILSPREQEVLALLGVGHTNREIGELLHVALPTVKTHVQAVFAKLGVSHRAAAVAEAMRRGLLD